MATLVPDPAEFQDVLKLVLELSDRPRDVKIGTVQAILLPEETLDRFLRFQLLDAPEESTEDSQPVKRRPGRPRKTPVPEEQS